MAVSLLAVVVGGLLVEFWVVILLVSNGSDEVLGISNSSAWACALYRNAMAVWLRLMALTTKSCFKFSRLSCNLQTACSRRKGWGTIVDYTPGRRVRWISFRDALPLEHNQDRQHK